MSAGTQPSARRRGSRDRGPRLAQRHVRRRRSASRARRRSTAPAPEDGGHAIRRGDPRQRRAAARPTANRHQPGRARAALRRARRRTSPTAPPCARSPPTSHPPSLLPTSPTAPPCAGSLHRHALRRARRRRRRPHQRARRADHRRCRQDGRARDRAADAPSATRRRGCGRTAGRRGRSWRSDGGRSTVSRPSRRRTGRLPARRRTSRVPARRPAGTGAAAAETPFGRRLMPLLFKLRQRRASRRGS